MIHTDAVADTGDILVRQLRHIDSSPVKSPGHDHKGTMAALRGILTEIAVEPQQFSKVSLPHHLHDFFIITGPVGVESVRAVFLQLMGEVSACHEYRFSVQFFCCVSDDLAQMIMQRQGKTGKPDSYD